MSTLRDLASQAQSYQQSYENGSITAAEYKELIEDLNIAGHIEATTESLGEDIMYRQILMGALQVASAIY